MKIEFGWSLDGASWADGGPRLGPRGLVRLLQARLGLTRPEVEPAVRVAQYQRRIAAADHPWLRASFAADPWATASTVLSWRDAAVTAGARLEPTEGAPDRIAALCAVENAGPDLAPGAADDLRELVDALADEVTWPLGIDSLLCHEDPSSLPGLWPRLLQLLEASGVTLERPGAAEQAVRPELVLVEAEDEWTAAETAARLLAGRDGAPLQLLAGADTVILDQELHRRGLPAVGVADSAAHRTALQILPLYLSLAVAPVDVQQLAAFLDLRVLDVPEDGRDQVGLVPSRARHVLLDALAQEPGTGGTAWQQAMAALEADDELSASGLEMVRALSALVISPLAPEDLTPARVREVTAPLGTRLRALGQGDPSLTRASTHLQVLLEVLEEFEPTRVLRERELAQIVASAGGRAGSPFARPEATSRWRTCSRPAQLLPVGGDVLWWGADRDDAATGIAWDTAEAEALTRLGARILPPARLAALDTDAGLRGLHGAERIVVVRTRRRAEEPTAPHALLAHLAAGRAAPGQGVADVLEDLTFSPAETLGAEGFALAGARREVTVPAPSRIAPLPSDLTRVVAPAPHLLPARLSYSQAEDLLGCRQKWTYKNGLQIRAASVASVPTGNRMIGTLVHAVVEQLVGSGERTPSAARIREEIETQVPRLASELLLPGREVELAGLRERAVRSLLEFFDRLGAAGLVITSVESRFEEPLVLHLQRGDVTVPFIGYRDVDAEDGEGRPTVIDLKWTYAARKYPELFETGEALQLAAYAHSLHEEGTDVGYFLLSQGEFVSANPALDPHGRPTLDIEDLWSRGTAGMTEALDEIGAGRVDARSGQILLDAGQDLATPRSDAAKTYASAREAARAQGSLVVDARCDYCEFSLLCGMRGDVS
ncbi:PD-(D/E)XK nuclease family protein [Brachybacterium sp. J144]|uniref:PD-(D/E)XK nuclease family protein n=1 Tax=Brachybacterium sp. J144 TaxID=3116487 RepID=UPI002E7A94E7|nr:PD-(D/E)XK nuclease family protein [Brachybacterium sp. J144]MEE1651456.1 PD-(D/E)XK nuclease family protein [Brachybacterium sp. J144]